MSQSLASLFDTHCFQKLNIVDFPISILIAALYHLINRSWTARVDSCLLKHLFNFRFANFATVIRIQILENVLKILFILQEGSF